MYLALTWHAVAKNSLSAWPSHPPEGLCTSCPRKNIPKQNQRWNMSNYFFLFEAGVVRLCAVISSGDQEAVPPLWDEINWSEKVSSPVEPRQEALCSADQLHHRSQEVIGRLAGHASVIRWAFPPIGCSHVQAIGCSSHPHNQSLQVISFHSIILEDWWEN